MELKNVKSPVYRCDKWQRDETGGSLKVKVASSGDQYQFKGPSPGGWSRSAGSVHRRRNSSFGQLLRCEIHWQRPGFRCCHRCSCNWTADFHPRYHDGLQLLVDVVDLPLYRALFQLTGFVIHIRKAADIDIKFPIKGKKRWLKKL